MPKTHRRRRGGRTRRKRRRRRRSRRGGSSLLGGVMKELARALPVIILGETLNLQGRRVRRGRGKGSRSKTRRGDLNYTTKKGDKVYHRKGRNVRRRRKPYRR